MKRTTNGARWSALEVLWRAHVREVMALPPAAPAAPLPPDPT